MTRISRRLRDKFWVVPLLFAGAAVGLALALTALDDWFDTSLSLPLLFAGGPEGARALLAAIITSMISFTALVFSITIVVLQLTSSQFSPRVLRTFLRDWVNQVALGVFVATFVYALVVLRAVRGTAQTDTFVPQLAVTAAFGFVLASVVVFLVYIDHIAQSIRAATIVTRIAEETREVLDQRHPPDAAERSLLQPPESGGHRVDAEAPGVVQRVDDRALLELAEEHGVTICLLRAIGEFVPEGAPLVEVHGDVVPDEEALRAHVHLGKERALDEDVGFGLRQLIDIAERALSPGVNDPTTAVQVIDQLHDLLRRLATRPLPPRQRITGAGRLAVHVPGPGFSDYLALAVDEIAHWGSDVDRVQHRLGVLLRDLSEAALPAHRPAVARALQSFGDPSRALWRKQSPEPTDTGLR
ncbi:DUF2254 domain-containing protein [Nocardioides eburneiflavus]|uniref:DUF2254 domain-containing protein n=1 Tax=Nocardioides eburneiflavus TaxID=2518372 RepID=A0A4Z1CGQ5_9ACTN|nr:DUF2254 domain-containing protein [Nocardioides eburneiflavus]TGN65725.1 DUF2254 domain-containing protein [Nocardioides eburneiflavus]